MRVVFHEREDAERVAARLRADGFAAEPVRERFAGEDDDEDHPWSVVTAAPDIVVVVVAAEYDGWYYNDAAIAVEPPVLALDLPDGPRRIKRPGTD